MFEYVGDLLTADQAITYCPDECCHAICCLLRKQPSRWNPGGSFMLSSAIVYVSCSGKMQPPGCNRSVGETIGTELKH